MSSQPNYILQSHKPIIYILCACNKLDVYATAACCTIIRILSEIALGSANFVLTNKHIPANKCMHKLIATIVVI